MKYRHELKYALTQYQYQLYRSLIQNTMRMDGNSPDEDGYIIRSLYFDDMYDTALKEKVEGVNCRKKYRIRIYNFDDTQVQFECKKKNGEYIAKTAFPLTRAQTEELIEGKADCLLDIQHPLAKEIYVKMKTRLLRPAVIVDYLREAYVYDKGNVRVTFDKDLCAMVEGFDLFSRDAARIPILPNGNMVMEIKYDEFLPSYIKKLFRLSSLQQSAFSKYVLCRWTYLKYKPVPVFARTGKMNEVVGK